MPDLPLISITRADGRTPLVFTWGVSSFYGWGVYGLNLLLHLAEHPDVVPLCAVEFGLDEVMLDPLRQRRLAAMAENSAQLWAALGHAEGDHVEVGHPLLQGLGRDLTTATAAHGKLLTGRPSIGVVFLDSATLSPQARQRADRYALIVAGSSWNADVLRRHGIQSVATVLQGVDTAVFHPAPRAGLFPGRFVVFSGGKLEFRKGQDLVLAAFRAFHQRHADALLLCAWHSPWSEFAGQAAGHPGITPPVRGADGMPDPVGWAAANGIPGDAVVTVGPTPNIAMAHVMREADVALFPNRCEGGTNLVAMECLACGIPTILSANTGHLDLLGHDIAVPLLRQGVPSGSADDTTDWGESDVEEMVEALEAVWRDREAAAALGSRAARFMAGMTWQRQVEMLVTITSPAGAGEVDGAQHRG